FLLEGIRAQYSKSATSFTHFFISRTLLFLLQMATVGRANPTLTLSVPPVFNTDSAVLPAVVLGVDSKGRTTYAVEQDFVETGSTTIPLTGELEAESILSSCSQSASLATLVEGSDYASYTFSASVGGFDVVVGFDCDIEGGDAICSELDDNSQIETTTFSSLEPFIVEVVSTASGVLTTQPSGTQASSTPQATNSASAPNKSQSSAPSASNKPSSSPRSLGSISGALVRHQRAYATTVGALPNKVTSL
ncbi:hypothetical protein C8R45DRAFT_1138879, partial [Mycena sanguinolenta]